MFKQEARKSSDPGFLASGFLSPPRWLHPPFLPRSGRRHRVGFGHVVDVATPFPLSPPVRIRLPSALSFSACRRASAFAGPQAVLFDNGAVEEYWKSGSRRSELEKLIRSCRAPRWAAH